MRSVRVQEERLAHFLLGCKKVAALPVSPEHKIQAMTGKYLLAWHDVRI